jgi:DnaK suppressor protein
MRSAAIPTCSAERGSDVDLEAIRRDLERRRDALRNELRELTTVTRDPTATIGFGKRVGDGTTQATGRIEAVGQAEALEAMLADVERALAKIDEGTYGLCDRCGGVIGDERLEARPWAVLCVDCSARSQ